MPWVSTAQQRWGNSPSGHAALGDAAVHEWNEATKGHYHTLPSHVKPPAKRQLALRLTAGHRKG